PAPGRQQATGVGFRIGVVARTPICNVAQALLDIDQHERGIGIEWRHGRCASLQTSGVVPDPVSTIIRHGRLVLSMMAGANSPEMAGRSEWEGTRRMQERRIDIAAIVGSVRRKSFNRGLMRTAMLLQPENTRIIEAQVNTL